MWNKWSRIVLFSFEYDGIEVVGICSMFLNQIRSPWISQRHAVQTPEERGKEAKETETWTSQMGQFESFSGIVEFQRKIQAIRSLTPNAT
jgi:hypothetical protein